ncbi:MAG: ribonuclease III [Candidatus Andersenbacteria bacterium CG10_big_fil_rev_8_21_14_0_10_54_11]|uniref:Ribonuclease 3 n=1 Tax=Candidatus Andersenbacteria bacterium CG10_big_fil_rev_8_21_14_0_10_54_11 TaxID=1974485 RepID=A0A2M6WZL3_9BACT|nr:MAG: ribonuclease III [Candidatus Andersenbacteria bacterium CG10_big_fil_rev_8_21_14_0_10_54_11]
MGGQDLSAFEKIIDVTFQNKDLLLQAFVHRSYLNEHKDFRLDHNERLEFLGDAVLELAVTEHLYAHYNLPEGELTNLRAAIVRGDMLSQVADEISMGDYMLLSRGEQKGSEKARQYILANAFEALIGSLYLDQGYAASKEFIDRYIVAKLPGVMELGLHVDAKSKFQELAQERYRITPSYRVLSEEGLDHDKQFVIGVFLGSRQMGEGSGSSKQEAQQVAARRALKKLQDSTA